jgi:hypothetical protein
MLATVDCAETPQAGYVPFAAMGEGLGIAISSLAVHYEDLLARRYACALTVSDKQAFGGSRIRVRIAIDVIAHRPSPNSAIATRTWRALETRHGGFVRFVRSVAGFETLVLEPLRAQILVGDERASNLDASETMREIRAARAFGRASTARNGEAARA